MPPRMVIQSPRLRSSVIAAVMLFVLVGSIVLAMVTFSGTHKRTFGPLSLELPAHWTIAIDRSVSLGAHEGVVFMDGDVRVMRMMPISFWYPVSPRLVLNKYYLAAESSASRNTRIVGVDTFRANNLIGIVARIITVDRANPNAVEFNMTAIVTRDGRQYWLIDMPYSGVTDGEPIDQVAFHFPEDIFNRVITTLRAEPQAAPSPAQLTHLGLPATLPEPWRATVLAEDDWPANVLLTPGEAAGNHLAFMRARVAIDVTAGDGNADGAFDPLTLLVRHHERYVTRKLTPSDVSVDSIGSSKTARVWRLTVEKGEKDRLTVQHWYARLGGGRAAVLELVSDGEAATDALADQATAFLSQLISNGSDASSRVAAAREYGVQLAKWHHDNLVKTLSPHRSASGGPAELTFRLTETRGKPSGFEIAYMAPAAHDPTWPLRVRSTQLGFIDGRPAFEHSRNWASNNDGSRFKTLVTTGALRSEGVLAGDIYQIGAVEGRVNMARPGKDGAPPQVVWNVAADAALIPTIVVDERWPIEVLKSTDRDGGEAILWLALDPAPPEPWVFSVTQHAPRAVLDEAKVGGDRHIILEARPAMAIDGHFLVLDSEGNVVTTCLFEPNDEVAGPTARMTRVVGQRTLERAFGEEHLAMIRGIVERLSKPETP